jgi:tRNA(fMet)-specific endonuclease VapC
MLKLGLSFLRILDTNTLSNLQRGNSSIKEHLEMFDRNNIAITIITAEEEIKGRFKTIQNANKVSASGKLEFDKLILAYELFKNTLEDLKSLNILEFSQDASKIYENLLQQKIRIGTQDLRIAAITLSVDGVLVTSNRRDFEKIPNLNFEDWTVS